MMWKYSKGIGFIIIGLILVAQCFLGRTTGTQAAPLQQATAFKTPTPGPDGKIMYTVQQGDTIWSIAAISGLSIDELRTINNLHPNQSIHPGDTIFLGLSGPALFTSTPGPTAVLPTPTPTVTPEKGTAKLCILLFNDVNGDSMREEEEPSLPGGAVNATEREGKVIKSEQTKAGMDPICFDKLLPGEYTISAAIPPGYNPTTKTSYQISLKAGDETYLNFGAQSQSTIAATAVPAAQAPAPESPGGGTPIPVFGIMGAFFLLLGVGVGIYAARLKRSSKSYRKNR